MTEAEWVVCVDPGKMLGFLQRKGGVRKKRLFACACCRLVWHSLPPTWRHAVETSERFADGGVNKEDVRAAFDAAVANQGDDSPFNNGKQAAYWACAVNCSAQMIATGAAYRCGLMGRGTSQKAATLLRDMFQPFHPITISPTCLTPTVVSLAQTIYDERAFDRMGILADALEEQGCDNADILAHYRQAAEHVKGCWVVDLVLGKK